MQIKLINKYNYLFYKILYNIKKICYNIKMNGGCSSFGRVSGCGSEGSGFDPRQSPQFISLGFII